MEGIDISDFQDVQSFHDVASDGISFIYSKATQSTYFTASSFAENRSRVEQVPGLAFGAYHFFDWSADPIAQAEHFLSVYTPATGDLVPMLDLELINVDAELATNMVSRFLTVVEPKTNHKKMLLYMNWDVINSQAINTSYFAGHPLWLAQYGATYSIPSTWTTPTIWQYTEDGTVSGIEGNVDRDKCFVPLDDLRMTL